MGKYQIQYRIANGTSMKFLSLLFVVAIAEEEIVKNDTVLYTDLEKAFFDAVDDGKVKVIRKMLKNRNLDPTIRDNYALRVSAQNGHVITVKKLLRKKADIHAKNDFVLRNAVIRDDLDMAQKMFKIKKSSF